MGFGELLVLLVISALVLKPKHFPEIVRGVTCCWQALQKTLAQFRKTMDQEIKQLTYEENERKARAIELQTLNKSSQPHE